MEKSEIESLSQFVQFLHCGFHRKVPRCNICIFEITASARGGKCCPRALSQQDQGINERADTTSMCSSFHCVQFFDICCLNVSNRASRKGWRHELVAFLSPLLGCDIINMTKSIVGVSMQFGRCNLAGVASNTIWCQFGRCNLAGVTQFGS